MQMSNQQIEERMIQLPSEIAKACDGAIDAEEYWANAKADYENEFDRQYLILKASNEGATVRELECMARQATHELRLAAIVAESKFKGLKNKAEKLKTAFSACQSSIKLRVVEMQSIGG